jgi:hypothetical protein
VMCPRLRFWDAERSGCEYTRRDRPPLTSPNAYSRYTGEGADPPTANELGGARADVKMVYLDIEETDIATDVIFEQSAYACMHINL